VKSIAPNRGRIVVRIPVWLFQYLGRFSSCDWESIRPILIIQLLFRHFSDISPVLLCMVVQFGNERRLKAVPTKNSVHVDFLDFSGRGQVAFRR
jgi:hypothetical protein